MHCTLVLVSLLLVGSMVSSMVSSMNLVTGTMVVFTVNQHGWEPVSFIETPQSR